MPTSSATFEPAPVASVTTTTGTGASFTTSTSSAAGLLDPASALATFSLSGARAGAFDQAVALFTEPGGAIDMIAGSSILPTSGAGTRYLGLGTASLEASVQLGVPQATARRLFITRDVAPGIGTSIVYTLRKNGADTGIVVTLSGSDKAGSSSPATTVSFLAGDTMAIKQVATGAVSEGMDNFVVEFQLT